MPQTVKIVVDIVVNWCYSWIMKNDATTKPLTQTAPVYDLSQEHICPDCGHYFECDAEPCMDFDKSCEPCVESDAFDASMLDVDGLDAVLLRLS